MIPMEKQCDLQQLQADAIACQRCKLRASCRQVVFGDGNPAAGLVLIGEAPGEQEDIQGRPFVGRAGQLLDRILLAIGLDRHDVYIANVIKCRPPSNRTPTPEEASLCWPWLAGQLEIIQPKIVVTLGSSATRQLVDEKAMISKVRGEWVESLGLRIMPTYHPAALLHNPKLKKDVWADFQQIKAALEEAGYPFRQEVLDQMAKERQKYQPH